LRSRAVREAFLLTAAPTLLGMPEEDRLHTTRRMLRQLLELIGDFSAQRKYERDVPIANVPAELVCDWFDDQYHPDARFFSDAFSSQERAALADFNAFYGARKGVLPMTTGVDALQLCKEWEEVSEKARATLAELAPD